MAYCASNAAFIDRPGAFPVQEFELIANGGLLDAPLQQHLGGWGAGIDASTIYETLMLLKHIGSGNLAVGRIYEGHVNALQLVQSFGTKEQIEELAKENIKVEPPKMAIAAASNSYTYADDDEFDSPPY